MEVDAQLWTFRVEGMTCHSCAARIEKQMGTLPGVLETKVDFGEKLATILACRGEAPQRVGSLLLEKLTAMGFDVTVVEGQPSLGASNEGLHGERDADLQRSVPVEWVAFSITGMSCASCAERIESALVDTLVPGVLEAKVAFPTASAVVKFNWQVTTVVKVQAAIEAMGYTAALTTLPCGGRAVGAARAATRQAMPQLPRGQEGGTTAVSITNSSPDNALHVVFLVEGMSCSSCAARIEQLLKKLKGVVGADVNFAAQQARVSFDPSVMNTGIITKSINGMGFTATQRGMTRPPQRGAASRELGGDSGRGAVEASNSFSAQEATFVIDGMSCASCAARIEQAIAALPGVKGCSVNFGTCSAVVTKKSGVIDSETTRLIQSTVSGIGYGATLLEDPSSSATLEQTKSALERTKEIEDQWFRFIWSAVLCIPLVVLMFVMEAPRVMGDRISMMIIDSIQFILTTPIVLYFGNVFFVRAWLSLRHGAFTMDTLVAIGTGVSYLYSVVAFYASLVLEQHMITYFDTAAMLMAFMLLGRYLEASAKRRTSGALIELMSLVPPVAIVITPEGDVSVPSAKVKEGDRLRVLPGDRVPVDGVIIEGLSDIDEQMVTGESVPKPVKPGASVVGGTLNVTAMLIMEAEKVGEDTMLAQILRIVQDAQSSKPAIQRIADRIAMYFVPMVLLISVLVLVVWLVLGATSAYPDSWRHHEPYWIFALNYFIATVVAACPCALGLATPTAIMVGTGVGARCGVLVKSGTTLEIVRRANCFVFDKTGTITNGRLDIVAEDFFHVGDIAPDDVRCLVGVVEQQSNHPVAKAVASFATSTASTTSSVEVIAAVTHSGLGIEATLQKNPAVASPNAGPPANSTGNEGGIDHIEPRTYQVLVGSLAMMEQFCVTVPPQLRETLKMRNDAGCTTVIGAIDGTAAVLYSLADEPKPEAASVIRHLQSKGARVLMVTGDNVGVAHFVARSVGLSAEDIHAEALPATKAMIVREMQELGFHVAFVGDGINDSPALAQANVGVALGAGTEIAIDAADAVLVRNSLVDLLNLVRLSGITVRRIYGNFLWAFSYNLFMLPLASGLLYPLVHFQLPPMFAGAAMVLSSLSVLTSSLSIRCFKPWSVEDFIEPDDRVSAPTKQAAQRGARSPSAPRSPSAHPSPAGGSQTTNPT